MTHDKRSLQCQRGAYKHTLDTQMRSDNVYLSSHVDQVNPGEKIFFVSLQQRNVSLSVQFSSIFKIEITCFSGNYLIYFALQFEWDYFVLFWSIFSSFLVHLWFIFGPNLVPIWFHFGSFLVPIWFQFGSNLVTF